GSALPTAPQAQSGEDQNQHNTDSRVYTGRERGGHMQLTKFISLCLMAAPAFAASCESLASLALPDTTITLTQVVPAGMFTPPGAGQGKGKAGALNVYKSLPEFCRVAATLKPSSDSDIKVEIWLPTSGWNRKLEAVGNGGWAGIISYSAMAEAL